MPDGGEKCSGCAVELEAIDGPTHRYIGASAGCWAVYGRLLAGDPPLTSARGASLLVDAYAAQHPGDDSAQATQSAAVHLVVLHGVFREGARLDALVELRRSVVEWGREIGGFPRLLPAPVEWELTIHDLVGEIDDTRRARLAAHYPVAVLEGWGPFHGETAAEWYRAVVGWAQATSRPRRN